MKQSCLRGFTLIELIIFIVVVAAGVAGILSVMNQVVSRSADPMVRKQAIVCAESLLEELALKAYENPVGGDLGSTRALFDDVDQYNGYTTAGGIVDVTGAAVPGLAGYNYSPAVVVSNPPIVVNGVTMKRITVSVTDPQGNVITLVGYRSNN